MATARARARNNVWRIAASNHRAFCQRNIVNSRGATLRAMGACEAGIYYIRYAEMQAKKHARYRACGLPS